MPTLGQRFKSHLISSVERYSKDLSALSEEQRLKSCAGKARTAYDFSYEVAEVFDRMSLRLQNKPLDPPAEGWTIAPDEFKNLDAALAKLKSSSESLGEVIEGLSDNDFDRAVKMGERDWTVFDIVGLCVSHTNYHDGQLNMLQCMGGDMEVHWW